MLTFPCVVSSVPRAPKTSAFMASPPRTGASVLPSATIVAIYTRSEWTRPNCARRPGDLWADHSLDGPRGQGGAHLGMQPRRKGGVRRGRRSASWDAEILAGVPGLSGQRIERCTPPFQAVK